MNNRELQDYINQYTYNQMGEQMSESVNIDIASAVSNLASLLPDLLAEYRKVRINRESLLAYLKEKGEPSRNQEAFAIRHAQNYVKAHYLAAKDLQKKVNEMCEHMDQFGDAVYELIDEREQEKQ